MSRTIKSKSAHRVFRRSMLLAIIGAVTTFSIADANPAYLVLSLLGISLAWLFSVQPKRPAPRLAINTILLLVVVIAGFEMLRLGVGVSVFAVFVALLLAVKLLDLRSARDDGQILILALAILIAAVLTSNTLLTGLLMVVTSVLVLRAVVLFQIDAVSRRSAEKSDAVDSRARIDIRSMMIASGFLCALIGSVIFVVLPRNIGAQAFGQWGPGRSVSGFSDTVELGRPGLISQSSTPVLDLSITDRNGRNIGGENTPAIYLRGAVLTEYESGRWQHSSMMSVPLTSRSKRYGPNTTLKPRGREVSDWDQQFDITMRSTSNGQNYLFAPWKTVEFRIGDQPMRLGIDFDRGIFIKDGIGGRTQYAVRSINTEFDSIDFSTVAGRDPTVSTFIEPEIADLARQILTNGGVDPSPQTRPMEQDQAAVRLIENYLRSQYAYTLDSQPVPSGEDATRWFLFERKTGHCEYYASALALMSRSIGVPARVVTGYIMSDFNAVTDQYVVRESNAHAWIEAEIAPGRWRTFDGTPRADFHSIHEPDPSLMRTLSEMYESIEFIWVRTVIGYDTSARNELIGRASSDFGLSKLGESMLNRFAAGRGRLISRAAIIAGIVFSLTMVLGILLMRSDSIIASLRLAIGAALRAIWARFSGRPGAPDEAALARLESLISRRLVRLGIPKSDWTPLKTHLEEHGADLALAPQTTREALLRAAGLLYASRFSAGPVPIDPGELGRLESRLRRSEKPARRR